MAIAKSDFRSGVLLRERRKPSSRTLQIVITLQFEMPAVRIHDQYFVDGIERGGDSSPHGVLPPMH